MALVSKIKYNKEKLDLLREYLEDYFVLGEPIDYEIIVDGFKAVKRTNNPEFFDRHTKYIKGDTKEIEVLFFQGSSNNNDKHIFLLSDDQPKEQQGLSGLEIDQRIQDGISKGIEKEKQKWEFDDLKRRNKELEEEVDDLEEEVEKLEKQLVEARAKESPMKGLLGEVGSSMVESFIRRNPQVLANIPGGQALAGIIENDNKRLAEATGEPEPDLQVTFRAGEDDAKSKETNEALAFVKELKIKFNQQQFVKLIQIIELLAEEPVKLDSVINYLKGDQTNGNLQSGN